jgi:hypothetical protein
MHFDHVCTPLWHFGGWHVLGCLACLGCAAEYGEGYERCGKDREFLNRFHMFDDRACWSAMIKLGH